MLDMNLLTLGLHAGGLYWVCSGVVVFLPVWVELAQPLWGEPGRLSEFALRTLFAAACAVLPGGSALGAAAIIKGRTGLGSPLGELEEVCPALVPASVETSETFA
jgi:hypothetical protein